MKINSNYDKFINLQAYKSNDKNNSENKIDKESSINIEISDSAKALVEKLNESNDIGYSEKVEKIRKAIIEGKYNVSSQDIADKLLQAMEEEKGSDL